MAMTGFICQDTYLAKTAKLSDQEVGRLFRALMQYHAAGEYEELTGRESIAFDFIKEDIDRAEESYAKKCEQARGNRLNGGKQETTPDNARQRPSTDDNARQRPSTPDNGGGHNKININKKDNKKSLDISFDRFWAAYPRHDTKAEARKVFDKLNPDEDLLATMLTAIEQQKKGSQWSDPRYIPQPRTWLNQRRWEDETAQAPEQKPQKQVVAQQYEQRDYGGEDNLADVLSILQGDMRL